MNTDKLKVIMADLMKGLSHREISRNRKVRVNTVGDIRKRMIKGGFNIKKAKRGRPKMKLPK